MSLSFLSSLTPSTPWAVAPGFEPCLAQALENSEKNATRYYDEELPGVRMREDYLYQTINGVAIIPFTGIVVKRGGPWFADPLILDEALRAARDDAAVNDILIRASTPGGVDIGLTETVDLIAEIKQRKNVYVFSDTLVGSAGYYMACAATELWAAPSSSWGGIGARNIFEELAKLFDEQGIKHHFFVSGQFKVSGDPRKEMEPHEEQLFADSVRKCGERFRATVSRFRPQVPRDAMEGQVFSDGEQLEQGLVDGLIPDLGSLVEAIASS